MTSHSSDKPSHDLPKPVIRKNRPPYWLIWIVPLLAAIAAGFYFYEAFLDRGPDVTIQFGSVNGLKPGESLITHHGVQIGKVSDFWLSDDHSIVFVRARLKRSAGDFAKDGAQYWIVRPQISPAGISGLEAITGGPYIDANPGSGNFNSQFIGLEKAPPELGAGVTIVLHQPRLGQLQEESPIYFRGINVGIITDIHVSRDSTGIDIKAFIRRPYQPLVRLNSRFWLASGLDVKGGLLTGVEVKLDSLRNLIGGGVTFATPNINADQAPDGAPFYLYDQPEKDWLNWAPAIAIQPD